jgi:hypothetical protein
MDQAASRTTGERGQSEPVTERRAVQYFGSGSASALIIDTSSEEGRAFMRATWGNFNMTPPVKPVGMVEALRQADELSALLGSIYGRPA